MSAVISPMPMGTAIPFTSNFNLNFSGEMFLYFGMTTATSHPNFIRARGREPTTSAKPPVLAKGTTSEDTKRTRLLACGPAWALDSVDLSAAFFAIFPLEFYWVELTTEIGRLSAV